MKRASRRPEILQRENHAAVEKKMLFADEAERFLYGRL